MKLINKNLSLISGGEHRFSFDKSCLGSGVILKRC